MDLPFETPKCWQKGGDISTLESMTRSVKGGPFGSSPFCLGLQANSLLFQPKPETQITMYEIS